MRSFGVNGKVGEGSFKLETVKALRQAGGVW
jgi:hypothetical protein